MIEKTNTKENKALMRYLSGQPKLKYKNGLSSVQDLQVSKVTQPQERLMSH